MSPRSLLLTIDAFGTIFHPRLPVPEQYASTAHAFGLSRSLVTPESLQPAFKEVFKAHAKRYPNYGRELALRGQYGGPRQWWEEVIRGSFGKVLNDNNGDLPEGLVKRLLDRFASKEGYALYADAEEFLMRMREVKKGLLQKQRFGPFEKVLVGVISNSDDRVPGVLKSLGLAVGDTRADQGVPSMRLAGFEERSSSSKQEDSEINDLDFIITSYEAGEEKPGQAIFDVAKQQAMRDAGADSENFSQWTCVHVGDDYSKDYQAAIDAGWDGYYVPRDGEVQGHQGVGTMRSLIELLSLLKGYK
ncbi:uncharacterized protein ACHE_40486S [Aspergillus chevalieri]|uniref:Haloacid dehalogenase-like hydrolase n=1 Tax=Aspergillus chevalieri TaxID=182096 RepID=A0A7R7ZNU3_ASPCH|nr:uncharacterized protein ACHE_40486S [Aspergillus chevalieri]BCR87921.1 hypothetical protein ACHE_40486S [Aspergillus chevalieri]